MRVLLYAIALIAVIWTAGSPAQAQTYDPRYRVCLSISEWGGGRIDCSFISIEQCEATATGLGGTCGMNPYFATGGSRGRRG